MVSDIQAAVVGGGPAGARVAAQLAHGGISTVLFEAEGPDVDNLCSGLLNAEGQAALGAQLPAHLRRQPFEPQLELHDLDSRYRARYSPRYWNMDRPLFDAWLREVAAEAGAEVRYRSRVSRIAQDRDAVTLLVNGAEVRAALVIDATGWKALARKLSRSDSARKLQPAPYVHAFQGVVQSDLPEDSMWAMFRSAVTPYYGWLVPKGGGRFLLGAGYPPGAAGTRRPGAAAQRTDEHPWAKLEPFMAHIQRFGGTVQPLDDKPLGCPITTIASVRELWFGRGHVFTLGEAAGLVSPSSGDGIHFCLEHANALAAELASALRSSAAGALDASQLQAVRDRVRRRLRSALSELRFNCLKSKVGANPALRGVAEKLLPLYLRRTVQRLPFPP